MGAIHVHLLTHLGRRIYGDVQLCAGGHVPDGVGELGVRYQEGGNALL